MSSIQYQGGVLDLDLRATIRRLLCDHPLAQGLLLGSFGYFDHFLGLKLF